MPRLIFDGYRWQVLCYILITFCLSDVDAWNVTIVTNPVGIQVDNQTNTFDYPILTNVTLICMVAPANINVISFHWTAIDCYNHSKGVNDPCFYSVNKTGQKITGYDLLAQDAGTVTCTAIINGDNHTSDSLTLRISGIKITGGKVGNTTMGDGNSRIQASNILDDYSAIYLNGNETKGVLFRCVTGLGPTCNDNRNCGNKILGNFFYDDLLLTNCNGFLEVRGPNAMKHPGALNAGLCGSLTTDTEGVYTCTSMNSSMMNQSMSVGIYFSGRTSPVIISTQPPSSALDVDIGSTLTLTCVSSGSPPDIFMWMKDGVLITNSSSITELNYTNSSAVFSTNYTISNLSISDTGVYTCTVSNPIGSDNKTINVLSAITVETTYSGITILQGDDITLSCRPSPSDIALQWSYNGSDIISSSHYKFTPSLNHSLTITNADHTDSGNYVCAFRFKNRTVNQTTIFLTVVPTCLQNFSGGLLWPTSRRNRVVTQSCSTLHPSFRSRVAVGRKCKDDGIWGPVDDSNCTALNDAVPTLIVSLIVNVSQPEADIIVDNITQQIISGSNVTFLSNDSVLYNLQQTGNTGVLIRLTSNELTENSTLPQLSSVDIPDNVWLYNEETKLFILGSTCRCESSKESVRTICIGPSISPCKCSQTSCECNLPYIGNGDVCGLDTDGDGCPDSNLECNESFCTEDLCETHYTVFPKCNSDDSICQPMKVDNNVSVCYNETDADWNISWPVGTKGQVVQQKCPGGAESLGLASRLCDGNPAVWHDPNVDNCSTVEITKITEEVNELIAIFVASQNPYNSDRNITVHSDDIEIITSDLASATDKNNTSILPNDLQNTINTLGNITSFLKANLGITTEDILINLIDIIDNVYSPRNQIAYSALDAKEEEIESAAAQALQNVVLLVDLISITLETDDSRSVNFTVTGESISIEVRLLSQTDINQGLDVFFPSDDSNSNISVQSVIPNPTIRQYPGPVANTYIANSFLPDSFDGLGKYNLSFPVLIVQISARGRVELPENGTVLMTFDILENVTNPVRCVFWQPERNSWSDENVSTIRAGNAVNCSTTHLTSFAVLVDTQGSTTASSGSALSTISYIGCSISIVCLLLTMFAIVYWRKSIYTGTHNIIHFNLCLSLLIGLVIFVSAIETAKDNKDGCTAVAILLHYFFLSTFAWMLCEGIFLFIFLNFIFYTGFLTKWYIYFGIGWGLPVPIVAIAAGIANKHYGSERGCWLSEEDGTIWAFVAPMLLIILINSMFLVIALVVIFKNKKEKLRMHMSTNEEPHIEIAKAIIISAATLMPILGVTWIFGLLAVNEHTEVFAWIFTLLNSLQGFFIFFFYVLRKEKVRQKVKELRRLSESLLSILSRKTASSSMTGDVLKVAKVSATFHEGNNKLVISPTEKIKTEPSSVLNNPGFLDINNTKTEFETSFNDTQLDDTSAAANVICNNIDNNLTSDAHPESTL